MTYSDKYDDYIKRDPDMDQDIIDRKEEDIDDEQEMVEEFLDKFCFTPASANKPPTIDLKLALKALPIKLDSFNYWRAS